MTRRRLTRSSSSSSSGLRCPQRILLTSRHTMRFTFALVVSVASVAVAVTAGVRPTKAGSKTAGHVKDEAREDDRFHLQSPDGQYVFGHITGNQGRSEMRAKDGTVTGYYSYVSGNGRVVYVNYVADKDGYRVLSNAGVPSASVTIVQEKGKKSSGSEDDFRKAFTDFTKRIEDKVVGQTGQTSIVTDPVDGGQRQVVVDIPTLYPSKETKPSRNGEKNSFPDWNQVKTSTTQKTTDEIKHNEGQQQQQELIDPIWDTTKITTQKSNIKGYDNDGQGSFDNAWTTGKNLIPIPLVPYHSQEITTEVAADSGFGSGSTVTVDDAQNNWPVTKYASITNESDRTTVMPYDRIAHTTGGYFTRTTEQVIGTGVKRFEGVSTGRAISESATVHDRVADENDEEKTENPLDADGPQRLTTVGPLERDADESFGNVAATTERHGSGVPEFQTIAVDVSGGGDYTTIETVEEKLLNQVRNSSSSSAPSSTTASYRLNEHEDSSRRFGDDAENETAAGIQHVTEQNKDGFEFRTLEPTETIGTTVRPAANYDFGSSDEVAQVHEIVWPEIPQEQTAQVLVPLDPYPEESQRRKNAGVKTQSNRSSRPARHFGSIEVKSNGTETTTRHDDENKENDENGNMFNFPRYFLTVG